MVISRVEIESITMLPVAFCFVIKRVTLPPLDPEFPYESDWALRKLPSLSVFFIVLFSRLIVAVGDNCQQ